jgi:two-component system sensor histidine kinase UhpB
VLQEALSNIARHSGADRAWVRLRFTPASLELEVEDHGTGMQAAGPRRGLGIVGMRERAALVGGSVVFTRPAEGGTLVRFVVSIPPVDQHVPGERAARAG